MDPKKYLVSVLSISIFIGAGLMFRNQLFEHKHVPSNDVLSDSSFGWKIPDNIFQLGGQVSDSGAFSEIRVPGAASRGLPVRLKIPTIGVNTAIEDALITPGGRMDVPAGSVNVAWFSLGPLPGKVGSAVIGGHFGIKDNVPFVFYDLDKLKIGDRVYIVDDKDQSLAFEVKKIKSFERNADSTSVFTSGDGLAHLNLITCEGIWNKVNDSYPQRLVVFTDFVKVEKSPKLIPPVETPKITPAITPVITNTVLDTSQTPFLFEAATFLRSLVVTTKTWF